MRDHSNGNHLHPQISHSLLSSNCLLPHQIQQSKQKSITKCLFFPLQEHPKLKKPSEITHSLNQ